MDPRGLGAFLSVEYTHFVVAIPSFGTHSLFNVSPTTGVRIDAKRNVGVRIRPVVDVRCSGGGHQKAGSEIPAWCLHYRRSYSLSGRSAALQSQRQVFYIQVEATSTPSTSAFSVYLLFRNRKVLLSYTRKEKVGA